MKLSEQENAQIEAAVAQAERRTSAEFALVLAQAADGYEAYPTLWAALAALTVGGVTAALLPWVTAGGMFAAEAVAFAVAGLILYLPAVRHRLAPGSVRREEAEKLARLQFGALVQQRTEARVGVLLFVSLAERYIEIVVDQGIAERIPQSAWAEIVDSFSARLRASRLADGFVEAIERCASLLEREFPAGPDDRNELPDQITLL
ncbi:MAG: hypothetical protein GC201_11400 [Alphaproteobacteria bacterium]|nr:hypothetical protein [Alphaproteobacteria bacterium]